MEKYQSVGSGSLRQEVEVYECYELAVGQQWV